MSDYTPNEAAVIAAYVDWAVVSDREVDTSEAAREFDRFIAKVKADALREVADEWGDGTEGFPYGPLHERADEIEGEA